MKRSLELWFVHRVWFLFLGFSLTFGFEFVEPLEKSNPAQRAQSGFGFAFEEFPAIEKQWKVLAAGEWGSADYRMFFFQSYENLDSLYRHSYGELDGAIGWRYLLVGGGYGVSISWVPGGDLWTRHHIKLGTYGGWDDLGAEIWIWGYTDEELTVNYGVRWNPSAKFLFRCETDGKHVKIGHDLKFEWIQLSMGYEFPVFSVFLGLEFSMGRWKIGGHRRFGNENMDENGMWVQKKL